MAEPPSGRSAVIAATVRAALPPPTRWQLIRYASVGVLVSAIYIGLTLVLSGPVGLPIQAAIPIAYVSAICVHFTLQRLFVFRNAEAFALAMHHQVGRYLLVALFQYAVAAIATAILPAALGVPQRAVYTTTAIVMSGVSFLLLRTRVFHSPSE